MKLKKPKKEEIKILVVDDETIVALDIKNTLEKYGYKVVGIAANSKEALQLVKSSKPNLILMDIMIKGSKDGIETAQEINNFADIPIIFLTAYSDDSTLDRAKLVEPYGYLIKPFDNRELFTTIEMSIYKHSMEVSIRESEESLAITLNSIGDAVISTNEKGFIERMNPVAEELTGWTIEESKGKPLDKIFFLIDATTREPITNPVKKVIESGEIIGLSNHTILIAKDGTERNISDSAAPIKDNEGNIRGVVLVFSDVTESYRARKQLKESEEKFRQLVTTMEQGLAVHEVIYDKKGNVVDYRFLDINESFTKLTGLTRKSVIGKTVLEVMPDTEKYWIETYGKVAITGNPIEFENYSQELGKYYHVVAFRNRPDQFAVIFTDVTDRKIAEEELIIKEQAMESSINAIALADLNGNLTYVNKSFLQLWGYKNEKDVLGKSSLLFWEKPDEAGKVLKSVLEKGSSIGELKAIRKDKQLLDLNLSATLVYGSDGKPVQIMASFVDMTERRKAENELIVSEEKFRLLVENAPLGIYYSNFKGEFIYGNKVAEDLIGYKKDELLGKNFLQCGLLSTNEIPIAAKLLARSLLGKPTGPDQIKLIKKDGTTVEVEINTQVLNVGGQKIIMGMVQDITERKRTEERIHLMADLLNLSPASVIVHDLDGKILFANKRTLEMHGYSEEEFNRLTLRDINTPESAQFIEERINKIRRDGELSYEVNHVRKDGSSFPLFANTKITKWNNQDVLLKVSNDITEKKLQEEVLRQKTEELDNYFTNALDLFCIANTDGYFIRLNKQWENVLGYNLTELEGVKFLDFVHHEDIQSTLESMCTLSKQIEVIGFVNRYRAKDGSYKFIEWRAYPAGERIYAAARDITDRKLAEDALRTSEEMFRNYIESAPEAVMVVDENGNYVLANKASCDMTGYTRDELLQMHIMDVTYPGDYEKGKLHFKNVVEKGEAVDEVRFVTKRGEVRYWSVKAVKLSDTRFLGFQSDTTDKKLAEIALKESEERYKTFIESTDDMAFVKDENFRYLLVNNVLAGFFGKKMEEVVGKTDYELMTEEAANSCKLSDLNALKEGHLIISVEVTSGRVYETRKFPVSFKNGKLGVGGYIRDITEQKKAQEAIQLSEAKFNRAFHASPVAMSIQDYQDVFQDVNEAFLKLTGYSREEIIGHTGKELMMWAFPEQRKYVNEQFKKHESLRNFEFQFRRKDGSNGYGIMSSELINIGGKRSALTAVLDITDRQNALDALKKSEFYLNKSQKVARIGSYLYDINKGYWIGSATLDEIFGIDEKFEKSTEGWISLIHPEFKQIMTDHLINHVIKGKNKFDKEYKVIRVNDGKEIWAHGMGELEFDKDGNPVTMIGTIQDITERKLADAALKESEEKFKDLFNTMPNGYYRSTPKGYFVDANPAFIKMLGYETLEELKSLYIPKDVYIKSSEREEILTSNPDFISNVETYRLKRKDGKAIWVEDNARYIKNKNGEVIFNEGICKDITDRKNAEDALRESEQLFNTLAQVSPVGIFRTRPDGYTTYVNPKWVRLAGLTADKAMGDGWLNALHPEDREKIKAGWDSTTGKHDVSVAEYRFLRPNGTIVWVMGQAIPEFDASNNIVGYVGTITDITERKQAEDALRESEERFRAITEQTSSLISLIDEDGIITYASPAARVIFNCDPLDMIGHPFIDFLEESYIPIAVDVFTKATTGIENTKNIELKMKRLDGSFFFGELNGSRFEWGGKTGSLVVIQDITERKNAEAAIKESEERLRILAEKTGTIVYDRNLISNVVHRDGAIEEVLGYSKEEYNKLTLDDFGELLHPEDRDKVFSDEGKVFKTGGNLLQVYRLKHKNGNYVYIEDNGIVLVDENGIGIRMLGSMKDITERKLSENALRESEERLRILAEKTGTIVYDRNLVTKKIHREGAIEEVLGYSRDELNSFNNAQLNELIDEKEKTEYFQKIKNILEKPGSFSINYKLKHKNGSFIFIEDNGIVLTDDNGNPNRVLGSMKDITLKKHAENELRKLSHAVEQSQVSIVITNREGNIEYVNPKFCEVTGYNFDEAIGQNPRILKSGDWKSDAYHGMWDDISSGRSWTGIFHNKKKNGELFWESAHISPIKDFNGEITHYIAVKEDITEKVKNEEQLAKYREHLEEMVEERTAQLNSQNNFLRSLIDTIPNPLFVKDSEGCYTDVNPAFEKFFGLTKNDILGKKLDLVLSGEAKEIAILTDEKLMKEKGIVNYETYFEDGNKNKIAVLVYKASFGTSDQIEGLVGIFFDISLRKDLEEKTIEALNREKELNEMKTNFISMASHEFRTPLTTILASADLVEMYYKKWPEDKVINHIKKIQDSVTYMTSLLDDVLTLSRADRGKIKFSPTKVNLKDLCSQLMNEIKYQTLPGHNLVFDYKLDDEIFKLDNKLLTQILNNLLSNAVKFSPEGGKILLSVTKKQKKIQFIVEDEGLGIEPNDLKNIFEPFYRGKNVTEIHGSGLGLNIVKNAVELCGGDIMIESEVNKGTKITFTIRS